MSSPKDLPKIGDNLKSELHAMPQLKHAETAEKIVLPSKEDVEQEKEHCALLQGIESFEAKSLKKTETEVKNPLPSHETIEQEKRA